MSMVKGVERMKLINEWKTSKQTNEGLIEWLVYRKLNLKGILLLFFVMWFLFLIYGYNLTVMVSFFKWSLFLFFITTLVEWCWNIYIKIKKNSQNKK